MRKNPRKKTIEVQIGNLKIGGKNPVAIQSMTNTPTADIAATYGQIVELINAGSELVRITVNDFEAAKAVPAIKNRLLKNGFYTPIVGDFHYNGHVLLTQFPDCAKALDKYRINPGNVGTKEARNYNFRTMIEVAIKNNKPVRIGVNWGSLDHELFSSTQAVPTSTASAASSLLIDKNERLQKSQNYKTVLYEAMVQSALNSAKDALKLGLPKNKMVLSVKMSIVQDMVKVYEMLSGRCSYTLHLGLTEAGSDDRGIVASTAALAILLQQGIGDTIRVSLTPTPAAPRAREVEICQLILQTLGIRQFKPMVSSCPGCGRTSSVFFQRLADHVSAHITKKMPEWKKKYPGVEALKIAVMGCVVNGPGESKHADIGISLPGKTDQPIAPVYIGGRQRAVLKGEKIPEEFIKILETYIAANF